mmetsp:Transcript_31972/g.81377  ORF Transcript_31972/g.81377 Transcript_31972/m.81377 type:complete len:284 (-) Transcript_31972:11-862(-)
MPRGSRVDDDAVELDALPQCSLCFSLLHQGDDLGERDQLIGPRGRVVENVCEGPQPQLVGDRLPFCPAAQAPDNALELRYRVLKVHLEPIEQAPLLGDGGDPPAREVGCESVAEGMRGVGGDYEGPEPFVRKLDCDGRTRACLANAALAAHEDVAPPLEADQPGQAVAVPLASLSRHHPQLQRKPRPPPDGGDHEARSGPHGGPRCEVCCAPRVGEGHGGGGKGVDLGAHEEALDHRRQRNYCPSVRHIYHERVGKSYTTPNGTSVRKREVENNTLRTLPFSQ